MESVRNIEYIDWAKARLKADPSVVTGNVPAGFDNYFRILHPPRAKTGEYLTWTDLSEVAGVPMGAMVQWDQIATGLKSTMVFTGIRPPVLGKMPLSVFEGLIAVLAKSADRSEWVFGLSTAHTLLLRPNQNEAHGQNVPASSARSWSAAEISTTRCRLPSGEFALVKGTIESIMDWFGQMAAMETPRIVPDLMWPLDGKWFIATGVDFDSTLLGADESVSRLVTHASGLEILKVDPEDSFAR
jgi:hypothetical protein